ncbi:hypothetical protein DUI87_30363 [Hirundo rustica rustica]|uniref:Uncharacterized protein n=1 Tax=Hirundo rustica rustica TaxID=333673 RepID=A0A3M0IV60_HIRRU|nr:hypothetical protein DUI87_30363 [Hirundo rustica rustica]
MGQSGSSGYLTWDKVKNEGAQEQVLEDMALANANKQCKAAILSLPMEPAPTLDDILQIIQSPCGGETSWGVTIGIPDAPPVFQAVATEERPTQKLNWKTDSPVWVEQWPLSKEKLKALQELVDEQLAKGHIVETTSPWNSPVFVIKKANKGKWRLLHDLRQINNVIEDMGSLQPGMPSQAMLPQNWNLAIIDIKDCFFQIPLHPDDASCFTFSVPTLNREAPRKRCHWKFLPQGMKNLPSICQWYFSSLLSPVRTAAGEAIILHYMDDVLMCAPNDDLLSQALDLTIDSLVAAGFELQEEKIQRMPPWDATQYLGLEIGRRTIVLQKLVVKNNIRTLADVQTLCRSLNWVRPWLSLTTEDLDSLFKLLKGREILNSPRTPYPRGARAALEKVRGCMATRQANRFGLLAGVVSRDEQAVLSEVSNTALFNLLSKLVNLISHREQQFYVMHIRSHTDLPGFIAEGNRWADALAVPMEMAPLPNIFEQAKVSHQLFQQNAPGPVRQFHLTREQAQAIVATCPSCQQHALPAPSTGANPRGLNSCEVWQTDVTHIMSFGRQRYVHVSVDTFSGAVYASVHTGEKSSDAMKHLIRAFSFLGIPKSIKTDNGPKYTSREFRSFLQQWGVKHKTGISYSLTGQAIVERTRQNLKRLLSQHQSLKLETPQIQLSKALFTLNFLNCTFEHLNPSIVHQFGENCQLQLKAKPPVMVKDPATRETEDPHDLITWGLGYACVSTPSGLKLGASQVGETFHP